ncbi:MAG: molybdopterin cofactor-binding domain-containing protein [Eisenbergiella sp.]
MTYVCGRAVQKAGEALFEKLIRAAGVLYGWDREEVSAADGQLCCRGGSKSYGEVAKEYEKACSRYLRAELEYEPRFPQQRFAEVKVDKYTGLVEATDRWPGQCMNRTLAEGQVGGAQMSSGMAQRRNGMIRRGQLRDVIFQNTMINARICLRLKVFSSKKSRTGL